jgi:DNA repair ATPase RecN
MEPLMPILAMLGHSPSSAAAMFGGAAAVVFLWLKTKKESLESITSISKMQSDHVEKLMEQNSKLAHDLSALRHKMAEALDEINALKSEMASLKHHLRIYETACADCPKKPESWT